MGNAYIGSSIEWAKVDLRRIPHIVSEEVPGPKSGEMHRLAAAIMKGYLNQVTQFLVVFEKGYGCTLADVDGNEYLDFSSGIYVTTLGHRHPKVTRAVQEAAGQLMNCHDFTTPLKLRLLEKLKEVLPGDLHPGRLQLQRCSDGDCAVELEFEFLF